MHERRFIFRVACIISVGALLALSATAFAAEGGGDRDKSMLALGREHLANGRYPPAFALLERLRKSESPAIERGAEYYLASACLQAEGPLTKKAALRALEKMATGKTQDIWQVKASICLMMSRAAAGKAEEVIQELNGALSRNSNDEADMLYAEALGDLLVASGDKEGAIRAYEHALAVAKHVTGYLGSAVDETDVKQIRQKLEDARKKEPEDSFAKANALKDDQKFDQALPLYQRVIARFPQHALAHPSGFSLGFCLFGQGKMKEAAQQLRTFIDAQPNGPWRGPAYVLLGDIHLEQFFELEEAKAQYAAAAKLLDEGASTTPGWDGVAYHIHQRMGLVAYVEDNMPEALKWFDSAAKLNPPRFYRVAVGDIPSGVERLADKLRRGEEVSPKEVRRGKKKAVLILLLGDVYYETEDYPKAIPLHLRIADGRESEPTYEQRAWANYQLARMYNMQFKFDESLARYLAVPDSYGKVEWADDALLRAGVVYYTNLRKPKEALECYERIVRKYPSGNEAERAAYYIGVVYEWTGRYEKAKAEYDMFLKVRPQSLYADPIRTVHMVNVEKHLQTRK